MEKEIKKSIGKLELIQYINEHPEINYIATVVTPYTFLCARAVLHFLNEELGVTELNGIIIVKPWQPDKWAIKTELPIANEYFGFYSPVWMNIKTENNSRLNHLLKAIRLSMCSDKYHKRKVYVIHIDGIWDTFAVFGKAYSDIEFEHFYLDEPREPYYNLFEWLHVMHARMSYFPSFLKARFRNGILQKIMLRLSGIKIVTLHTFDRKKFFSEKYVKYMKIVFKEEGNAYDFCPQNKYILYLSNAYEPNTSKLITSIAEEVLSQFAKQGYKIYIKQHPRENCSLDFKTFEPIYIPNYYAVESFLASVINKPSAVIGAETTSMAKIASFWNIPCYCLLDNPSLWNKKEYEWFRGYNDCAMRGISEFMYSRNLLKN
ncbi:polysialyltransferase family glycosyltransferase [Treponema socranskii]|uniref:polysialyltransferase family glycosyltransferase n=1 Tax=Treponema socranskii TaxID=53419 RepID=UPI003D6FCDF5